MNEYPFGMNKEEYDKFSNTMDEAKRGMFEAAVEEIDKVLFDKEAQTSYNEKIIFQRRINYETQKH